MEGRSVAERGAVEATVPLLGAAAIALEFGLRTKDEVLALDEDTRKKCFAASEDADRRPRLSSLEEVMAPLAPYSPDAVAKEAARVDFGERREEVFGGKDKLPEKQAPRHMAIQINNALHDLFAKYPETLLFGEDVAQKGGV